jgi:hypothetical protein
VKSHHHFCQSVDGAIKNWSKREWKSFADGNGWSIERAKEFMRICSFEGKRVLPIGKCEGFSYKTGCPGHPVFEALGPGDAK